MPSKSAHKTEAAKSFHKNYKLFDLLSETDQKKFASIKEDVKDITAANDFVEVMDLFRKAEQEGNQEQLEIYPLFQKACQEAVNYHEAETKVRVAGQYVEAKEEFEKLSGWSQFWAKYLPAAIYGPADKYNKMAALKEVLAEKGVTEDPADYYADHKNEYADSVGNVVFEQEKKAEEKTVPDVRPAETAVEEKKVPDEVIEGVAATAEEAIRNELLKNYNEEQVDTFMDMNARLGGKDRDAIVFRKCAKDLALVDQIEEKAMLDAQKKILGPQLEELRKQRDSITEELSDVSKDRKRFSDLIEEYRKKTEESAERIKEKENQIKEVKYQNTRSNFELQDLEFDLQDELITHNDAMNARELYETKHTENNLKYVELNQKLAEINGLIVKAEKYRDKPIQNDVELKNGSLGVTMKRSDVEKLAEQVKTIEDRAVISSALANVRKYETYLTQGRIVDKFVVDSYNDMKRQYDAKGTVAKWNARNFSNDYQKMQDFKQMLDDREIDPENFVPVVIDPELADREKDQTMIADLAEKTGEKRSETVYQTEKDLSSSTRVEENDLSARNTI